MLAREYPERVLFITGEAGIGKSTLLRQLVEEFRAEDAGRPKRNASNQPLIAHTECSTPIGGSGVGQVEALKPFADIMSSLIELGGEAAKKSTPGFKLDVGKFFIDTAPSWLGMIPVLGAPIFHALAIVSSGYDQVHLHRKLRKQGDSSATTQEQVFRQYVNFLKKLSEHTPVVLILDDFHWADTSSTNLLFAAARDLADAPIVFIIGYRPDDVKATALHEEHPLVHVRNEI
jgi:Cdc6-like AAA superfamily ATPase